MQADVKLLSFKEIQKTFDEMQLTTAEGNRVKIASLKDAMKQINIDAKTNLSSMNNEVTGNLSKSLGMIGKARASTAYVATGARTSGNNKGNHFHFVNSGTEKRQTSQGYNRGAVTGSQFYDKAVLSNISSIPARLSEAFDRRFTQFMEKKYSK